jgi:nucleoside-diphosphate-sugar epimerase
MDVIRMIEKMVGKEAKIEYKPFHPADIMATWANIGKAERLLGWRPQVTFEAGVKALVEWYQINRDWAKDIVTG